MKTIQLASLTVPRIGYGTMRLPGPHVFGPPKDHETAIAVLKRAVSLGIRVFDTAWYYGPDVANELVAEALYPYPDNLILVTKLGGTRDDAGNWLQYTKPQELRDGMERDLRLLKVDSIHITHLRWMGNQTVDAEFEASIETMLTMKQEGKLQHLGLSNVSEDQLSYVLRKSPVATVSNAYSLDNRLDDDMVNRCAKENIAYLPYFPLAVGKADDHPLLSEWAKKLDISASQVALAWLLQRSPTMLPIPGTSSVAHLEENTAALNIELPHEAIEALSSPSQAI